VLKKIKYSSAVKTRITLAFAAIVLLGAVGYGATVAIAQEASDESHPFVQILAEKLGLNEDEVEEALDEIKADKYAQMQESKEDMLQSAVDDGVITEEQRQAWLEKHEEMWTERKQEKQQHKEEMDAWFEQEGINHEELMEYMGGFKKHGGFYKWGMGKIHTE
jgi:hypothetical protein